MAWTPVFLLAVVCLSRSYAENSIGLEARATNPDVGLRVPQLVQKYGYPFEAHFVQTEDNYILQLHRIPYGKDQQPQEGKPVVLLVHGLLSSSADWIVMGPEKGLGYVLADMGYDVWMANARGTYYSRNHTSFNPDRNAKFWHFSWHEIAVKDLPASIDFILGKTGQKDLYYIGHSQGTTASFVLTASLPEYNEKIRIIIALGPTAYMKHAPNPALTLISQSEGVLGWVADMVGVNEFLPSTKFMRLLGKTVCSDDSMVQQLCTNILFLFAGWHKEQLNATMLPVILSNAPAGASTRQVLHYAQLLKSGKFQQYDFGLIKNLVQYHDIHPPKYETSKITCPVALLYGNNDLLTSERDIYQLSQEIKHLAIMWKVKDPKFNHLDFIWSIDIKKTLYPEVFSLLKRF